MSCGSIPCRQVCLYTARCVERGRCNKNNRELFLYGLKPSGGVLFYLKLVNVCMKMKIIAKLRIKTYIKNETNNGKTTVYTFSRKLKNNKPKQGRTEEKQLFLLEK